MKKPIGTAVIAVLLIGWLSGCSGDDEPTYAPPPARDTIFDDPPAAEDVSPDDGDDVLQPEDITIDPNLDAIPDDVLDGMFIEVLGPMPYGTDEEWIMVGHQICDEFDQGSSWLEVILTLEDAGDLSDAQAGGLTGVAIGAYCNEYASQVPTI